MGVPGPRIGRSRTQTRWSPPDWRRSTISDGTGSARLDFDASMMSG